MSSSLSNGVRAASNSSRSPSSFPISEISVSVSMVRDVLICESVGNLDTDTSSGSKLYGGLGTDTE